MATRLCGGTGLADSIHLKNCAVIMDGQGAPTSGTTGKGLAGPGSLYIDVTGAKLYINTNTKASPTWTVAGTQS